MKLSKKSFINRKIESICIAIDDGHDSVLKFLSWFSGFMAMSSMVCVQIGNIPVAVLCAIMSITSLSTCKIAKE